MRLNCILLGVFFGVAGLAGCAGDGMPTLIPVKGKVELDGKPLAFKTLEFIPEPGTPGLGAGGTTKEDGTFSLISVRPGAVSDMNGCPAGTYKVVVKEPMFPIEGADTGATGDEVAPAAGLPAPAKSSKSKKASIPSVYSTEETTPLRVTVTDKGDAVNLTLTSNPSKT